jgi:hypothetical protein
LSLELRASRVVHSGVGVRAEALQVRRWCVQRLAAASCDGSGSGIPPVPNASVSDKGGRRRKNGVPGVGRGIARSGTIISGPNGSGGPLAPRSKHLGWDRWGRPFGSRWRSAPPPPSRRGVGSQRRWVVRRRQLGYANTWPGRWRRAGTASVGPRTQGGGGPATMGTACPGPGWMTPASGPGVATGSS